MRCSQLLSIDCLLSILNALYTSHLSLTCSLTCSLQNEINPAVCFLKARSRTAQLSTRYSRTVNGKPQATSFILFSSFFYCIIFFQTFENEVTVIAICEAQCPATATRSSFHGQHIWLLLAFTTASPIVYSALQANTWRIHNGISYGCY
jgi:hypothetical protein